jgi:hypothetical protein
MVPSERVVVPSNDCVTPARAVGAPVVVSGFQVCAHAPEHVDCEVVSASKR